jgi:hypothetical protein
MIPRGRPTRGPVAPLHGHDPAMFSPFSLCRRGAATYTVCVRLGGGVSARNGGAGGAPKGARVSYECCQWTVAACRSGSVRGWTTWLLSGTPRALVPTNPADLRQAFGVLRRAIERFPIFCPQTRRMSPASGVLSRLSSAHACAGNAVAALGVAVAVAVPGGWRRAGLLRPGDLVLTQDGAEPVVWVNAPLRLSLVEVAPGVAVTAGTLVPLDVSGGWGLVGCDRVLCPAGALGAPSLGDGDCVAVLLARHAGIRVGGAWCGSFRPTPPALAALPPGARRSLRALHPRALHAAGQAGYLPALPVIDARERAWLAALTARGSDHADRTAAREAGSRPS